MEHQECSFIDRAIQEPIYYYYYYYYYTYIINIIFIII